MLLLLAGVLMLAFVPVRNAHAAKPLTAKDFVFKANGKTYNFIKNYSKTDAGCGWLILPNTAKDSQNAKKYLKPNTDIKAKDMPRGIGTDATYQQVAEKYGSTSKIQAKSTERIYKYLKYGCVTNNVELWKSYVEYRYKKSGDVYSLRFCFDKQDKVIAIIFIKNEEKVYNYPNKQFHTNIKFRTPTGENVETMTMNGKKVYVIPKGTMLSFGAFKNRTGYYHTIYLELYDQKGNSIANYPYNGGFTDYKGYGFSLDDITDNYMFKYKAKKPLQGKYGKYGYFVLWLYSDDSPSPKMAPEMIYFRFK